MRLRLLDGRESMRDHQRRAVVHQLFERSLDDALGFGVECRGRLVENQDGRVLQQRARDGNSLPLPAGQQHAAIADDRVEACRQLAHELDAHARPAPLRSIALVDSVATERDVRAYRIVEQHHFLTDERDLLAQAPQLVLAHIVTIDEHAPVVRVVEPRQQIDQRRLAAAGLADDRQHLAGRDLRLMSCSCDALAG